MIYESNGWNHKVDTHDKWTIHFTTIWRDAFWSSLQCCKELIEPPLYLKRTRLSPPNGYNRKLYVLLWSLVMFLFCCFFFIQICIDQNSCKISFDLQFFWTFYLFIYLFILNSINLNMCNSQRAIPIVKKGVIRKPSYNMRTWFQRLI